MSWGGNWQQIRIAARGNIVSPGYVGGTYYNASLALGVFASTDIGGGFLADRSEAYIGGVGGTNYAWNTGAVSHTLTFGNTGSSHYATQTGYTSVKKVNDTVTLANSTNTTCYASAMPAVRSGFILQILKSTTGAWGLTWYWNSAAATAIVDKSWSAWVDDAVRTDATPTGYTAVAIAPANPGAPFINKTLDSVSLCWTHSSIRFQLQDLLVVRIL